jgi:hypothetical protein
MKIENTLQNFLNAFAGRIKAAGGYTEIYHVFSSLDSGSDWIEHCYQNMIELHSGAKDLLQQVQHNEEVAEILPTLDDIAFHAAIFGNYFYIFESIFTQIMTEKGDAWNYPKEITYISIQISLIEVLQSVISSFERLLHSFTKEDLITQRKFLIELYLVTSQLQGIAAKSRLNT